MKHKNLIDLEYMTKDELQQTINLAKVIKSRPEVYKHACDGKIMATLFYEPSTRTQITLVLQGQSCTPVTVTWWLPSGKESCMHLRPGG